MIDREQLEQMALFTVSAEHYYDLCDNINEMTNEELAELIKCNGNYKQELKLQEAR